MSCRNFTRTFFTRTFFHARLKCKWHIRRYSCWWEDDLGYSEIFQPLLYTEFLWYLEKKTNIIILQILAIASSDRNGNRNVVQYLAYSRFQARDSEKIRSEFLTHFSLFLSLCLTLSSLRYILNTKKLGVAHFEEHSEDSSLPHQFLSLTKCLPVLYFTVFSVLEKKLTDENFFSNSSFSFFFR